MKRYPEKVEVFIANNYVGITTAELQRELNLAMSRANGLYQRWFAESGINSYLAQTLYALYMEPALSQKEISEHYMMPRPEQAAAPVSGTASHDRQHHTVMGKEDASCWT